MDSSPAHIWDDALANGAFYPAVSKDLQFYFAFALLLVGLSLTGAFALNRSLVSLPLLGVPASAAIAFGTVYMFCAVGVHV